MASCLWSSAPRSRSTWRPVGTVRAPARATSRCASRWRARRAIRTRSSCRAPRFARGRWPCGLSSHWRPASSGDGLRATAGAGQAGAARSRTRVGPLSFSSVLLMIAAVQGPGTRLSYRIRVIEPAAVTPRVLASGAVSGPLDSDMRLTLRTDTAEVEALFHVTAFGDTVTLGGEFLTRRLVGRSRRGLPLWEEDTYRRQVRFPWSDTTRIYPFGTGKHGQGGLPWAAWAARAAGALWVELILEREFAGGEARPAEAFTLVDSTRDFRLEAVVRPRRARVILNL